MGRRLLIPALFLVLCPPSVGEQSIQQKLQATAENYTVSAPTFAGAIAAVASRFEIPVGIEIVATPSVLRPVNRRWRKASAREILTTLVDSEKGYALRADDGIVHIFGRDIVHERSNFLNIRLKKFEVRDSIARAAQRDVWYVVHPRFLPPEPPRPGPYGIAGSFASNPDDARFKFSLSLSDVTVRGVLNKIALSSNYPIWIVAFAPGDALTPTGFRRTVSPTHASVLHDGDQPAWQTLRWGEKPY
ncbi:MAG: hypothetical protein KGL59_07830 [Acidobacteriota bacterium]|nr:hypothetical protein [Acidobacteriota bacterium]